MATVVALRYASIQGKRTFCYQDSSRLSRQLIEPLFSDPLASISAQKLVVMTFVLVLYAVHHGLNQLELLKALWIFQVLVKGVQVVKEFRVEWKWDARVIHWESVLMGLGVVMI